MSKLRVIGDVHGWITKGPLRERARSQKPSYTEINEGCEYSVQLGDMSFDYNMLNHIDPKHHRFFPGNHDNFDTLDQSAHSLGRYGCINAGGVSFFFCGGGFSLDKNARILHEHQTGEKTWWEAEEMRYGEALKCLELYKIRKPKVVITHEAPRSISNMISDPAVLRNFGYDPDKFTTNTSELLQTMLDEHQPHMWIFGHYHKSWHRNINGTLFRCLDKLEYMDLEHTKITSMSSSGDRINKDDYNG